MGFRRQLRSFALAATLLAVAPSASARADLKNENILVPLPQGFKLGWRSPDGHMQEFVQPSETVENWSRMITIQIFSGLKNGDPDAFASRLATAWKSHCPDASADKVRDATEHGYPITVWVFVCPLNPATHKPETMGLKAIGGADSLYVAQYAARQAVSKEIIAPAMQFLRQVAACDTRRADRPCPASSR